MKNNNNNSALAGRVDIFLADVGLPVTVMCKKLDMSTSTFYRWKKGELAITQERLKEIDNFLNRFGY